MVERNRATNIVMAERYEIDAPFGRCSIPTCFDEADDPYLGLDRQAARKYYDDNGYVVFRNVIPEQRCDRVRTAFDREVRPYDGFLYRQATANPERHVLTEHGYMLNSMLNMQDLPDAHFPAFKMLALDVLTDRKLHEAAQALFDEPAKLVQSMYFEGNPATWAHQDTYYLDAATLGRMAGVWIALEDIAPGAGRFYVFPTSHQLDMVRNGADFDIAFNHERYKQLVLDVIRNNELQCSAPALRKGDVLFWSAKTIHGSLPTTEPQRSRSSLTCHLIPVFEQFMRYQKQPVKLQLRNINGTLVHCPKDQQRLKNRAVLYVETRFPRTFQTAKKLAIKMVLR